MRIKFNKIHINNFLSMGDATISLCEGGYTLVNGVNTNPDDTAKSNGSGKSTIFEAIIWAITGETIRGSKDVANINGNDGAIVELDFTVDDSEYKIIRTKDHSKLKNSLRIFVNGEDKSAKGIRDTEKLLQEYLPDLTSSLIGSVIILGQGLPQRFTNNTPAGRKEVLEKLSKSDFMLEDLKNRVSARKSALSLGLRNAEDSQIKASSTIELLKKQIEHNKLLLENLPNSASLQEAINLLESSVLDCTIKINTLNLQMENALGVQKAANSAYTEKIQESNAKANEVQYKWTRAISDKREEINTKLNDIKDKYDAKLTETGTSWNKKTYELKLSLVELQTECKNILTQITSLKNITDTCPTCGQKLPDVHKPDTSALETAYKEKLELSNKLSSELDLYNVQMNKELSEINAMKESEVNKVSSEGSLELSNLQNEFNAELTAGKNLYQNELDVLHKNTIDADSAITKLRIELDSITTKKSSYDQKLSSAKSELSSLEGKKSAAENAIMLAEKDIADYTILVDKYEVEKTDFNKRLDIIGKMTNVITRDFRGYLLVNIIDFINRKSKEYSLDVFDTDKIEFALDGNNISIKYDNKDYASLSGGEKQKVDIIVQFAIRDMLCKYLNFSSNILVLDEICDNVDSVGAEKLFNMISRKLSDVQDIFIISHHTDFQMPCDRQLTIVKGPDKISRVA